MSMKKINENVLATVIGLVTVVVLLEIIFRTLLPAAHLPESTFDVTYRIPKFLPGEGQYTIGKFCIKAGHWHINNAGWNSPYDYVNDQRKKVAIIGDSYIEAFQVDIEQSIGPILQKKLGSEYQVMSFGTSGAPLSQYLHMSRYVRKEFRPDVLVFNIIHNDFDESLTDERYSKMYLRYKKVNDSTFAEDDVLPSKKASTLFSLFNYMATGRYLLHNLKVQQLQWPSATTNSDSTATPPVFNANIDVVRVTSLQQDITTVVNTILQTIKKENPDTRIIFVMDGLRMEIYSGTYPESSNVSWINLMMSELCKKNGVEYVDLSETFARDYTTYRKKFEFPFDWHWNTYGHGVAASALHQQLTSIY